VVDNKGLTSASYASIRSALQARATTADDITALNGSLPAFDPNPNAHPAGYFLTNAQMKALGFLSATWPALDDTVTSNVAANNFDFDRSDGISAGQVDFIGLLAYIVSSEMGRFQYRGAGNMYALLDIFNFGSFSIHNWTGNASASYFSIDNGFGN